MSDFVAKLSTTASLRKPFVLQPNDKRRAGGGYSLDSPQKCKKANRIEKHFIHPPVGEIQSRVFVFVDSRRDVYYCVV